MLSDDIKERRRSPVDLHESEERLRRALWAGEMGTWRYDLERDEDRIDPSMCRLLGLPPGTEVLSLEEFMRLVHEEDRAQVRSECERILKDGGQLDLDFRIVRPDGAVVWLRDRGTVIRDAAGQVLGMTGAAMNITQQRIAEESSRKSEEKYRSVIDAMEEGFALCEVMRDTGGHVVDFRFLEMNPAYERVTARDRRELVGRRRSEIQPPMDGMVLETFARVVDTGEPTYFEHFAKTQDQWFEVRAFARGDDHFAILVNDITERKRSEMALRTSEQRYQSFMQQSSEGIWRFELTEPLDISLPHDVQLDRAYEQGYLAECNDAMARMYGFQRADELHGVRIGQLMPRNEANESYLKAFFNSGYKLLGGESEERDREGRTLHFSNNLVGIIENGMLLRVWGTQTDITERKRAEEALRSAIAKYGAVFNQSGIFAGIMDLAGNLREVNDLSIDACGYTREQVLDQPFWETPWWRGSQEVQARIEEATHQAAAGTMFREMLRYWLADGTERVVDFAMHPIRDASGTVIFLHPTGVDITERRQVEIALRASEERLRAIVSQSTAGVAQADLEGTFMLVNARFCELLGYTEEELLAGLRIVDVTHPDDRDRTLSKFSELLQTGSGFVMEKRYVRKNGTMVWVNKSASAIRDLNGEVKAIAVVVADITESKLAEAALLEADRRKDEFLAILAHELRNPLAPVRSAVQVVNMQGSKEGDLAWAMDIIDRQTERMSRLIDDLMDVSRISRGKLKLRTEIIDLCAAVREALEICQPIIRQRKHELSVSLPPVPVMVNADLTRLAQIFANLLNNAAKYTEPHGRIQVAVVVEGDRAVVRISDNGIGLLPDHLPGIFDMFAQVEGVVRHVEGGLGIGLNLVKSLVEMHGGTVQVESEGPGKGSTFTVALPITSLEHAPLQVTVANDNAANGGLRILVVDDNMDALITLDLLLQRQGHRVRTASDGEAAIAVARDFRPEVVLLDIGLPGMNGYDVARDLRSEPLASDACLIAITGWGQKEDKDKAQEAGFDHHLVKPVDPKALIALIARVPSRST